jgi:hypothetical protein
MNQATRHEALPAEVLDRLIEAVQGIRYGAVEITVHDGRVVQIERTEKLRLGAPRESC